MYVYISNTTLLLYAFFHFLNTVRVYIIGTKSINQRTFDKSDFFDYFY